MVFEVALFNGAALAEITGVLPTRALAGYPEGTRVIVRRERPHPGAQLDAFEEADGFRYTAFATDKILQVYWTGARYAVRSDLDLTVAYYHETQNSFQGGTPATQNAGRCKDASLAQCSGQIDAVSFVADYKFSPHANAYAGIMWSQVSNGLANGFLQRSSIDPTVGLRYRF